MCMFGLFGVCYDVIWFGDGVNLNGFLVLIWYLIVCLWNWMLCWCSVSFLLVVMWICFCMMLMFVISFDIGCLICMCVFILMK